MSSNILQPSVLKDNHSHDFSLSVVEQVNWWAEKEDGWHIVREETWMDSTYCKEPAGTFLINEQKSHNKSVHRSPYTYSPSEYSLPCNPQFRGLPKFQNKILLLHALFLVCHTHSEGTTVCWWSLWRTEELVRLPGTTEAFTSGSDSFTTHMDTSDLLSFSEWVWRKEKFSIPKQWLATKCRNVRNTIK